MGLPLKFVEENTHYADQCSIFGIEITQLSRDELIASLAFSIKSNSDSEARRIKESSFISELRELG